MADSSWVHGLRLPARCLTAVKASTEKSKFLVGSVGAKNNVVSLLEFDEEHSEITSTSFHHPNEVWDLATCPTDENLFISSHSPVSGDPTKQKATLWRIEKGSENVLTELVTLNHTGVVSVLWDPVSEGNRVISMDATQICLSNLDKASGTSETVLSIEVSSMFTADGMSLQKLQRGAWSPHHPDTINTVGGQCLAGWDLRSGKSTFKRQKAHKSTIRALDYNNNKPHHVVTGGDDARVCIWDVRNLTEPAMTVSGHTHWVWSVAMNQFHDQLLLTSGSDTQVCLHSVVSVSSASYLRNENGPALDLPDDDEDADYWENYRPADGLICTFDQHEDSVYSVAWSPADTWTFASLSYPGRVVISQVPTGEKFKILGV